MADHYTKQQVGVADGTVIPADRADGREVGARSRVTLASKVTGTAWASTDRIYLGKKPAGMKIEDIKLTTGTSLGSATIDIGDGTTADKYVDGATLTDTDVPTSIGPVATELAADPGAEEDLWATVGAATIASGTELTFAIHLVGTN